MITITNGHMILTVSNSAYETMFKYSGYHPILNEECVDVSGDNFITPEKENTGDENFVEETEDLNETFAEAEEVEEIDLSEIPLSEMDFYQLCEYADQLGLDRRGLRSKKELRALIKANI